MATLSAENGAILELDLGSKHGTRHIAFSDLWDSSTSQASYQCLLEMVLAFTNTSMTEYHCIKVVYMDKDEHSKMITTDKELTSAFEHFSTRIPLIVSAKAYIQVEKKSAKIRKQIQHSLSQIGGTSRRNGGNKDTKTDGMDVFLTNITETVNEFSAFLFPLAIFEDRDRHLQPKQKRHPSIHTKKANGPCARRFEMCSVDSTLKEIIRWSLKYMKPKGEDRTMLKGSKSYFESKKDGNFDSATLLEEKGATNEKVKAIVDIEEVRARTFIDNDFEHKETILATHENNSIIKDSTSLNTADKEKVSLFEANVDENNKQDASVQMKFKGKTKHDEVSATPKINDCNNKFDERQGDITDDIDIERDSITNFYFVTSKPNTEVSDNTASEYTIPFGYTINNKSESEISCHSQLCVGSDNEWQLLNEDEHVISDSHISEDNLHCGYTFCKSDNSSDKIELSLPLSSSLSRTSLQHVGPTPSIDHSSSSGTIDSWSLGSLSTTDMMPPLKQVSHEGNIE